MNKKKIITFTSICLCAIALSGCTFVSRVLEKVSDTLSEEGNNNNNSNANFDVNKVDVDGKTIIQQTYKDYSKNNLYPIDYCPNQGDINLLIIPVWFTDSSNYIDNSKKEKVRQDIEKAYLGTNEETGWRSVKTYYEELSSNAITITGTVSDWYSVSYSTSKVGKDQEITDKLVPNAVDWYFTNNPSDSRTNYDSDNNGYIDAVMLIYGAPDYDALGDDSLDNLWAYCYWLQEENENSYPIANAYFWASYDFMYSSGSFLFSTPAGSKYGSGDTTHCNIDAHTYIHEMGHVFGLEDYYDYSKAKYAQVAFPCKIITLEVMIHIP